jgi:hypothetical protein
MFGFRCHDCGKFMRHDQPGSAWWAAGEFGEDTERACAACALSRSFKLIAGNGSTEPRWCGRLPSLAASASGSELANAEAQPSPGLTSNPSNPNPQRSE